MSLKTELQDISQAALSLEDDEGQLQQHLTFEKSSV